MEGGGWWVGGGRGMVGRWREGDGGYMEMVWLLLMKDIV